MNASHLEVRHEDFEPCLLILDVVALVVLRVYGEHDQGRDSTSGHHMRSASICLNYTSVLNEFHM